MKTPLVSLRRVSVSYDGHDALKEVDLDIYPDDFLGIIGPNGGGKTTLVKAIVGTIPYRGTISYSPQLFRGKERLIGYMPQQSIFDRSFPISVLEVVMSGLQGQRGFHARYASGDRAKAQELLRTAGIDGIARKPIGEISGGQMQRALLCRAVISDPKLLILDEPANFVDNRFENELYRMLARVARTNGDRNDFARSGDDYECRAKYRLCESLCPPARFEHHHRGAAPQLRLPYSAYFPRQGAAYGACIAPARLLSAYPYGGVARLFRHLSSD